GVEATSTIGALSTMPAPVGRVAEAVWILPPTARAVSAAAAAVPPATSRRVRLTRALAWSPGVRNLRKLVRQREVGERMVGDLSSVGRSGSAARRGFDSLLV